MGENMPPPARRHKHSLRRLMSMKISTSERASSRYSAVIESIEATSLYPPVIVLFILALNVCALYRSEMKVSCRPTIISGCIAAHFGQSSAYLTSAARGRRIIERSDTATSPHIANSACVMIRRGMNDLSDQRGFRTESRHTMGLCHGASISGHFLR